MERASENDIARVVGVGPLKAATSLARRMGYADEDHATVAPVLYDAALAFYADHGRWPTHGEPGDTDSAERHPSVPREADLIVLMRRFLELYFSTKVDIARDEAAACWLEHNFEYSRALGDHVRAMLDPRRNDFPSGAWFDPDTWGVPERLRPSPDARDAGLVLVLLTMEDQLGERSAADELDVAATAVRLRGRPERLD